MGSDVLGEVVVRSPLRVLVNSLSALQPRVRHGSMHRTPGVLPPRVVLTRAC
jgi:hypothetical protein